jgi:pyridoxamine 5'-phosphate oxidase
MAGLRGWQSFPDELPEFDPGRTPATPQELFRQWLFEAGEHVLAPNAATLSTVDDDGFPDARVVVLRDVDVDGWSVSTSSDSPKGVQLTQNPRAALTFFWPGRGRQIRLRGPVTTAAPAASAADFSDRSPASKAECLIGRQSEVLSDPADLTRAAADAERRVREDPYQVPETWTRYVVLADTVEFWQASADRRHLRLRYRRDGDTWAREQLWP